LLSDLLEIRFNPHTSSHGHSGAELTRLPLNGPTSKNDNCNARWLSRSAIRRAVKVGFSSPVTIEINRSFV
jgi:hypothetical protein